MLPFAFSTRLVLLLTVFAVLAAWQWHRDRDRWKEYAFVLIGGAVGASAGVAIDLVTSTISPAYFVVGKGVAADEAFLSGVVALGFEAGFSAGAIAAGAVLIATMRRAGAPSPPYRALLLLLVWPLAFGLLGGFAAALCALSLRTRLPIEELQVLLDPREAERFLIVWSIHAGVYAGAVVGLARAIRGVRALRDPCRLVGDQSR